MNNVKKYLTGSLNVLHLDTYVHKATHFVCSDLKFMNWMMCMFNRSFFLHFQESLFQDIDLLQNHGIVCMKIYSHS